LNADFSKTSAWLLAALFASGLAFTLALGQSRELSPYLPEVRREALVLKHNRLFRLNEPNPFTGFLLERYDDHTLKARSGLRNGVLDGFSDGWHTNGVRAVHEVFKNGLSHGLRQKWYPNGNKLSEASIVAGQLDGPFRRWDENGALAEEIQMKNGLPHGFSRAYYQSGRLKTAARVENGKLLETHSWPDLLDPLPLPKRD
jgi:antitoxin component YwqK of YwqJK toxin-antitoxin module